MLPIKDIEEHLFNLQKTEKSATGLILMILIPVQVLIYFLSTLEMGI